MFNPQTKAPLLETLAISAQKQHAAFYAPGHKRGQGTPQSLADLLGKSVFRADLPELPELDNLFAPEGVIQEAQQLAAEAFGAAQTWFLINGSTAGIIAAILATCGTGDKIILPRNVHQSAISGLILSGAIPIFIHPEYNPEWDIAGSITPASVSAALAAHPDAKAVMMVYPTYQGICGEIKAIADITHQHGIPLLVDEAHGPHFAFHPDLPTSALVAGVDLSVQSIHKVLGAMTQASMLHVQGDRIHRHRLAQSLQLMQSTSPSYLLLASLDAARRQMALQGRELMTQTLKLAESARTRIAEIPGLSVLEIAEPRTPGFAACDRTRLTVSVTGLGINGYCADEILHDRLGVTCELPSSRHLTFIISLGNTQADIDRLVEAFRTLAQAYLLGVEGNREQGMGNREQKTGGEGETPVETRFIASSGEWEKQPSTPHPSPLTPHPSPLTLSPREVFFAPVETVPVEEAIARVSAELVCPYPPGIPVLMPGETICSAAIAHLQQVLAEGGTITGCSDPTLKTLQAVKNLQPPHQ